MTDSLSFQSSTDHLISSLDPLMTIVQELEIELLKANATSKQVQEQYQREQEFSKALYADVQALRKTIRQLEENASLTAIAMRDSSLQEETRLTLMSTLEVKLSQLHQLLTQREEQLEVLKDEYARLKTTSSEREAGLVADLQRITNKLSMVEAELHVSQTQVSRLSKELSLKLQEKDEIVLQQATTTAEHQRAYSQLQAAHASVTRKHEALLAAIEENRQRKKAAEASAASAMMTALNTHSTTSSSSSGSITKAGVANNNNNNSTTTSSSTQRPPLSTSTSSMWHKGTGGGGADAVGGGAGGGGGGGRSPAIASSSSSSTTTNTTTTTSSSTTAAATTTTTTSGATRLVQTLPKAQPPPTSSFITATLTRGGQSALATAFDDIDKLWGSTSTTNMKMATSRSNSNSNSGSGGGVVVYETTKPATTYGSTTTSSATNTSKVRSGAIVAVGAGAGNASPAATSEMSPVKVGGGLKKLRRHA